MKILTYILNFFKKAFSKEYLPLTFGIIILLLIIFNIRSCNKLNSERDLRERDKILNENNLKAMKDTIFTYYDKKLNQFVSEKTSYMVKDMKDLMLYNEKLYNEMKNIKGVVAGINTTLNIIVPIITSIDTLTKLDSNTFKLDWKFPYSDAGLEQYLAGNTRFKLILGRPYADKSTLSTNTMKIKIKYAFVEEGDKYKVWATSPSNLVKFQELDGVLFLDKIVKITPIDEKNKPWTFGVGMGFGLNTDIKGMNSRLGWNIGGQLTYKIFDFGLSKKTKKK